MKITYLNHSSVLIQTDECSLLCDPWFLQPAFETWMPMFATAIHPTYIASLKNLKILISHGHDDHCDDKLLSIFNKDVEIITSNFANPSVVKRMQRLGFKNITEVDENGVKVADLQIKSYRQDDISSYDAIYTIKDTGDNMFIHCNDNWFKFTENMITSIRKDITSPEKALFASQTNSASGYPTMYLNYNSTEKRIILERKVKKMIKQGMDNCKSLGLKYFLSYAGYANVYLNNNKIDSIVPTPEWIKNNMSEDIPENVEVINMLPSDSVVLGNGNLQLQKFFNNNSDENELVRITDLFYKEYNLLPKQRHVNITDKSEIEKYMSHVKKLWFEFLEKKATGTVFNLRIEGINNQDITFNTISCETFENKPTRILKLKQSDFFAFLFGQVTLDTLYTGHKLFVFRIPDEYDRNIINTIIEFGYYYKSKINKI